MSYMISNSFSYLIPFMDIAVKFHSWMPFCNERESSFKFSYLQSNLAQIALIFNQDKSIRNHSKSVF